MRAALYAWRADPLYSRMVTAAGLAALAAASLVMGTGLALVATRFGAAAPVVMLAVPLVPILAAAALAYPPLAVMMVFASFPLGLVELPGGLVNVVQAAVLLAAGLVAAQRVATRRAPLTWAPQLWWAAALVGWTLIALSSAVSTSLALKQVAALVGGVIFATVVPAACRSMSELRQALAAYVASSTVTAALALLSPAQLESSFGGAAVSGRLEGAFGSPNQLGSLCGMAALVAAGLLLGARTARGRFACAAAIVVLATALALSLSRGAWIGATLGVLLLLVALREARRAALVLAVPLVAAAAFSGSAVPESTQIQVIGERLGALTAKSPYDERPAIWREAIREIRADPLTGHGPGGFPVASLRPGSEASTVYAEHAHNIPLTWSAEAGLPALLLIVGLSIAVALAVVQASRLALERGAGRDRALVLGIGAALVLVAGQGMVDYTLRNSVIFIAIWGLIGAVLAAQRIALREAAPTTGDRRAGT